MSRPHVSDFVFLFAHVQVVCSWKTLFVSVELSVTFLSGMKTCCNSNSVTEQAQVLMCLVAALCTFFFRTPGLREPKHNSILNVRVYHMCI